MSNICFQRNINLFVHAFCEKVRSHTTGRSQDDFITILAPQIKPRSVRIRENAIIAVKIIFAPITLLALLVGQSLSFVACSFGVGTGSARQTDSNKRNELRAMGGVDIQFRIAGQSQLEGMFFESNGTNPNPKTILLCTGSHQSYEFYACPMVEALVSMGHRVMVFNYEGFGKSGGARTEEGVYRSTEAAYQYLKQEKGCSDDSIVAWGYSLGSGAVADLSANHPVDIVLDRPFSSMSQVAYQAAPYGLKTLAKIIFIGGAHFNNIRKISTNQSNVFIAQGRRDMQMLASHHGEPLIRFLAHNSKAMYREVNSGHLHNYRVWFAHGSDRDAVENFLAR